MIKNHLWFIMSQVLYLILIMYHAHNTFQFEIPCSQLLVELYQPIQCSVKIPNRLTVYQKKMIIISIILLNFIMIHKIFALKHHYTDTQQKSSTFVMHHSQKIYFSMKHYAILQIL